jgi:hypothetical protein
MKLHNLLIGTGLTALLLGCGSIIPRASEEDLLQYRKMELANAPQAVSCLKEGEYLIPDAVLDIYARIVDPRPTTFWSGGPVAGTIDYNRLQGQESEFLLKLGEKGYSKKESQVFYTILSTPGNIFFKQSESREESFPETVLHERVHKEFNRLNPLEQVKVRQAYEELRKRAPPDGLGLYIDDKLKYHGFVTMAVDLNWKEFFPYLAQGALEDYVEEALKQEFPEAYDLFLGVKEKAKVECGNERTQFPTHFP